MKKIIILLTSCLLVFLMSCTSVPGTGSEKKELTNNEIEDIIRGLVTGWSANIENLDEGSYSKLFHERSTVTWLDGSGQKRSARNPDAIIQLLREPLYSDMSLSSIDISSMQIKTQSGSGKPQAIIVNHNPGVRILFDFSKPVSEDSDSKLKIRDLYIFEYYEENIKAGEFQKWADKNGNGYLEQEEQEELYTAFVDYGAYTGMVRNSLDEYFDRNEDGFINDIEVSYAERVLHHDTPMRLYSFFPDIARNYIDTDGWNHISVHLANGFFWDVFDTNFYSMGRRNMKIWDRMADQNSDRYVNREELLYYVHLLGRKLSQMPPPPVDLKNPIVLHKGIQNWADFDGDGKFSENELEDFGWLIYEILSEFHDLALNPLDFYFNLNQNYFLEEHEKENVFIYLLSKYLKKLKKISLNLPKQ